MIIETKYLVFVQPILALALIGVGTSAEERLTSRKNLEISKNLLRLTKRSASEDNSELDDSVELESNEERDCPRPRKEFWHPKFKKCVPFCRRNVKRDKFTGLCLDNTHQPSWNYEDNVYIPRHGQV